MPVGPSHSGRSSSSGSSGSFNVGGSSSTMGGYKSGPWSFPWFGRTIIISGGRRSALSSLLAGIVIAVFVAISFFSVFSNSMSDIKYYNDSKAIMEADAVIYKNAIQNAGVAGSNSYEKTIMVNKTRYSYYDDNPSTPGIYYDFEMNGVAYYFIVYEYENEHYRVNGVETTRKLYNQTYTQFSINQVPEELTIVYFLDEDGQWYSINKNYSLERNMQYKYYENKIASEQKSANIMLGIGIFVSVIAIVLLVLLILKFKKAIRESIAESEAKEARAKADVAEANARAELAQKEVESKNRVCAFCGSDVPDGAISCPSCGAKSFKQKD